MSAVFSQCGAYRYRLERPCLFGDETTAVIMVNPSTAGAVENDHTIRKLLRFRHIHQWGNLVVGNLFAYRATDVRDLARAADPVGRDNDTHLRQIISGARRVIVAWGPTSKLPKHLRDRWHQIVIIAGEYKKPLYSIGAPAKDGHPRHPLMLAYHEPILPWSAPA